jgi:hypothetical protein
MIGMLSVVIGMWGMVIACRCTCIGQVGALHHVTIGHRKRPRALDATGRTDGSPVRVVHNHALCVLLPVLSSSISYYKAQGCRSLGCLSRFIGWPSSRSQEATCLISEGHPNVVPRRANEHTHSHRSVPTVGAIGR